MSGFIGEAVKKMKRGWLEILDKNNIIYDENNHPHFGTKRKVIKKAWVGNANNEPELALYSEDYHYDSIIPSLTPFNTYNTTCIVYNNRVYFLGVGIPYTEYGTTYYNYNGMYSWDGINWRRELDTPYQFGSSVRLPGCVVVYNNKIHILGGINSEDLKKHYSYDGTKWVSESTLPKQAIPGYYAACVSNDRIYLIVKETSALTKYAYAYDGTEWTNIDMGYTSDYSNPVSMISLYDDYGGPEVLYAFFSDGDILMKYFGQYASWQRTYKELSNTNPSNVIVYNNSAHFLNDTDHISVIFKLSSGKLDITVKTEPTLPESMTHRPGIIYNDVFYIFTRTYIYHLNDQNWITNENYTLPKPFYNGSAVVYDEKIHILGGDEYSKDHYSFDGINWSLESNMGFTPREKNESALLYNNKIYIPGIEQNDSYRFYYFDNGSWIKGPIIPTISERSMKINCMIVYNNKIHIFGGAWYTYTDYDKHYSYDGTEWVEENDLENGTGTESSSIVVYNNKIYIIGGRNELSVPYLKMIEIYYDDINSKYIQNEINIPYQFISGAAVVYHDKIHIFGGSYGNTGRNHYSYDGVKWKKEFDLPYDFSNGSAVVYKDEIYLLGGQNSQYTRLETNLNHYFS